MQIAGTILSAQTTVNFFQLAPVKCDGRLAQRATQQQSRDESIIGPK